MAASSSIAPSYFRNLEIENENSKQNRYLSKSVNRFSISLRDPVHRVSTKISQDCPTSERSQR